jgi:hypothetical protein
MVRINVRGKDLTKEESEERGRVVLQALVKHGVDAQKLKVSGLGSGPNRVELIVESRIKPVRNLAPIPTVNPAESAATPEAPAEATPAEATPAGAAPTQAVPAETAPPESAPSEGARSPSPKPPAKQAQ